MVLFEQDREPAAIDERQSGEFIYGSADHVLLRPKTAV
jgi:hypothetical protein